jgi:hypothetical protein
MTSFFGPTTVATREPNVGLGPWYVIEVTLGEDGIRSYRIMAVSEPLRFLDQHLDVGRILVGEQAHTDFIREVSRECDGTGKPRFQYVLAT